MAHALLQKHRRFAHARLTAQQYDTAQYDAAAQYAVKLGNASQDAALFLGRADVGQTPCRQRGDALLPDRRSGFAAGKPGLGRFGDHILIHGVPTAAAGAAAHPAGACLSAIGAYIDGFQFHVCPSFIMVFCYCNTLCQNPQEKDAVHRRLPRYESPAAAPHSGSSTTMVSRYCPNSACTPGRACSPGCLRKE